MPETPGKPDDDPAVTRYIRELEEENARLDLENRELKAALLALAGGADPEPERKRRKLFVIPGGLAVLAGILALPRRLAWQHKAPAVAAGAGMLAAGLVLAVPGAVQHPRTVQPGRHHARTATPSRGPRGREAERRPVPGRNPPLPVRPAPPGPAPSSSPPASEPPPVTVSPVPSPGPSCIELDGVKICLEICDQIATRRLTCDNHDHA